MQPSGRKLYLQHMWILSCKPPNSHREIIWPQSQHTAHTECSKDEAIGLVSSFFGEEKGQWKGLQNVHAQRGTRNLQCHGWKEVDLAIHSSLLKGMRVRSGFGSCSLHGFLGCFRLRQDQEESPVWALGLGLEAHDIVLALESSTMTLEYSGLLHQKHKSSNTWAPTLNSKPWNLLLCLGLNEGVKLGGGAQGKENINSSAAPVTTTRGLASCPETVAVQLLHPFLLHCHEGPVYSRDHGKFQKKSKSPCPCFLPRVPETPAEFLKFRRLLASLHKPESKFLAAEPSLESSHWGFCIASNNLCFCFCFAWGLQCY